LIRNVEDGPAPQYDFCGQRGPVKREMSHGDKAVCDLIWLCETERRDYVG
jgi:hypothetical protein